MASGVYKPSDNGAVSLRAEDVEALLPFNGRSLGDLCKENQGLLVFPDTLGANEDDIHESPLYWLQGSKLFVGNTVGFWSVNGAHVHVRSRFDTDDRQYLFHYMLQRVCGISVLNLKTMPDPKENLWEFLMYLFPMALKRAMAQGVYRAYRLFSYNDDHVRGPVSVSSFIRRDIPFGGRIAYVTREHSGNNHVTQLIRHTIEFIRRRQPKLLAVDQTMRQDVDAIIQLTQDYSENHRAKILAANLRPVRHPFYTEYTTLQKICLSILRHEKLSFGEHDDRICGIIFDAAWLWEEYLATVFSGNPITNSSVVHTRNKVRKNPIYFYKGSRSPHYPDFYDASRRLVIDAKYKHLGGGIQRDDLFQLISYVHVLDYSNGGGVLLYPGEMSHCQIEGELNGCGGRIARLSIVVPHVAESETFADFSMHMAEAEQLCVSAINGAFPCHSRRV